MIDEASGQEMENRLMEKVTNLNKVNFLVQARNGLFIANCQDVYLGNSLIRYGESGALEWELLKGLIEPGSTVVEVGANIGTHTVSIARAVGDGGRVIAVEPQRVIFQYLCANISLNGFMNVETYHCGCGSEAATLIVPAIDYSAERNQNFGGVSLQKNGLGESVEIRRLDDLVGDTRLVRLIKIDVEGMEADVLRGAMATIRASRPILYVENDRIEKSEELIRLIMDLGYRLFWHIPPLFNPDNYFSEKENVYGNVASYNMVCFPCEETAIVPGLQEIIDPAHHPLIPADLPLNDMLEQALHYHNAGQFSLAERMYADVVAQGPSGAETWKNYGNTLLSLERFNEAESAYGQALAINPDSAEVYNNLGIIYQLGKHVDEAKQSFTRALALLPGNVEIHNNFGNALMEFGQTEEAELHFRKAIVLNPGFTVAYVNRGNALMALGRYGAAEKSYRQAISLDAHFTDAHIKLDQLLRHIGQTVKG